MISMQYGRALRIIILLLLLGAHSELSYLTVDNYNYCCTILCFNIGVGELCSVYYIIIAVHKNLLHCIKFVFRLKNKIALRPTKGTNGEI